MEIGKQEKGEAGEQLAAEYLQSKNFIIKERNWRIGHLEVDLIAIDSDMLVFIEVKTRKSSMFGNPEDFVTIRKQKNLIRAANIYVQLTNSSKEVRFDIVSVILNGKSSSVQHIRDAFKPRW